MTGAQVERFAFQFDAPGFDARNVEQFIDEFDQTVGAGLDDVEKLALLLCQIAHFPGLEEVNVSFDRSERRA